MIRRILHLKHQCTRRLLKLCHPNIVLPIVFLLLLYLVFSPPGSQFNVQMLPCPPIWTPDIHFNTNSGNGTTELPIDCASAFKGDEETISYAKQFKWCTRNDAITDDDYIHSFTKNCDTFKERYGYNSYNVTLEEEVFPIAFSILLHENVEQAERLLRMIYRPQNVYCVHVDLKAPQSTYKAFQAIAGCFKNIIIPKKQISVHWAEFTVLEAELVCMEALWHSSVKWKYLINLTGRDFPLKTNWELVQILTAYNGANDIDGTPHRRPIVWTKYSWRAEYWRTDKLKESAPNNFLIHKGSTHIAATRAFIGYVLFNQSSHDLLEWMRDIRVPDEHFFNTLNHHAHKGIPGAYKGDPDLKTFYTRLKIWMDDKGEHKCAGRWVRFVCQLGVGDLHQIVNKTEMFVNKFFQEMEPLALDCAEQWYRNRTKHVNADFNLNFYQSRPFVNNHV